MPISQYSILKIPRYYKILIYSKPSCAYITTGLPFKSKYMAIFHQLCSKMKLKSKLFPHMCLHVNDILKFLSPVSMLLILKHKGDMIKCFGMKCMEKHRCKCTLCTHM